MKRILCAYDGSPHADKAVDQAADLAAKYGATLRLLYVVEPYVPPLDVPGVSPVDFIEPHKKAAERLLKDAAERVARTAKVAAETEVRVGSPPHEIVECAAEQTADLVVLGSRGQGALKRFLLGSVADRVTHLAAMPVLIVR